MVLEDTVLREKTEGICATCARTEGTKSVYRQCNGANPAYTACHEMDEQLVTLTYIPRIRKIN